MTDDDDRFDALLRASYERDNTQTPPVRGIAPSRAWFDEAPGTQMPPQHGKPGKVAKVATFVIIAMATFFVVAVINWTVRGARDDSTTVRTDPMKCEALVLGRTQLTLTQASSVDDFNARLQRGDTASSLFPECRGLTTAQARQITDRVTARLAPMITARALEWSRQTG